jgi:hypothetical protein
MGLTDLPKDFTDFENVSVFKPGEHHVQGLDTALTPGRRLKHRAVPAARQLIVYRMFAGH